MECSALPLDTILQVFYLNSNRVGDVALGGTTLGERGEHFNDNWKPLGFDTKQIFVSPSIRYAGHNCYAKPERYAIFVFFIMDTLWFVLVLNIIFLCIKLVIPKTRENKI